MAIDESINYWVVGVSFGGNDSQLDRFIENNIWENGYSINDTELNNSIIQNTKRVDIGDIIIAKSSYTRKHGLPFNNFHKFVSVMQILNIGKVISKSMDGIRIGVEWNKNYLPKEWYFFTYRTTLEKIDKSRPMAKMLIDFTINNSEQNYDLFLNDPFWKEKYSDRKPFLKTIMGAPAFVKFMSPIIEALYNFQGEAKPSQVQEYISNNYECEELKENQTNKNGGSKFANRVAWARFYLMHGGLIKNDKKGIWALADKEMFEISNTDAIEIFKSVQSKFKSEKNNLEEENFDDLEAETVETNESYNLSKIIQDGCFINIETLKKIENRLKDKKNLILQGAPGTGKTWLAKRLGYAVIGAKDEDKIKLVQFHANMTYEDFVRGYRPNADKTLSLSDGPMIEIINKAKNDSENNYVLIIEEINRGNPAHIFGEMLTLLENSKRGEFAIELTYSNNAEKVTIPKNLYVIGTMNGADRSLAMVDFALRRRFAFFEMLPQFNTAWLEYMVENHRLNENDYLSLLNRINLLNKHISDDLELGASFSIGHSFFTNDQPAKQDFENWIDEIIEFEIEPLLREYYLGDLVKTNNAIKILRG